VVNILNTAKKSEKNLNTPKKNKNRVHKYEFVCCVMKKKKKEEENNT